MKRGFLFRVVPYFIGLCFFAIIAWWAGVGYVVVRVAKDPSAAAENAGNLANTFWNAAKGANQ